MRSNLARQPKKLRNIEFDAVRENLHSLIKERREFNIKAFLTKKTPRYMKNIQSPMKMPSQNAKSLQTTSASLSAIDLQKVAQLDNVSAIKPTASIFEKLISKINSSSSASGAGPPSAVNDLISIQIAIGNVQGSIDSAIAEVAAAKSPAQRASAQQKLSTLMMQKMRLEAQLGQAKIREINKVKP